MAKMTYQQFDGMVSSMFATAQENLVTDGHAAQVLIGVDAYGRMSLNALIGDEEREPTAQTRTSAAREQILLLAYPLSEHAAELGTLIRTTKTVALIHVSEAWSVLGGATAQDLIDRDLLPSEHENRIEILYVAGMWPREFYTTIHTALIVRDEHGRPTPRPSFTYGADHQAGPVSERMVWFLRDLLPQPYPR